MANSVEGNSKEQEEVLMKIDEIIPHFVWNRLKIEITCKPWKKVSLACLNSLPNHQDDASKLYFDFLKEIDKFIEKESKFLNRKQNKLQEASAGNISSMRVDKNKIMTKYGKDHISFIHAMVRLQELAVYLEDLSTPVSSPGPLSGRLYDEAMEEAVPNEGRLEIDEQWAGSSPSPQFCFQPQQGTQMGNDQKMDVQDGAARAIQALEDLIKETRDEIIHYNECHNRIKLLAAGVFPKEKSLHDKMTLEELSPASIDQVQFNNTAHRQNHLLEMLNRKFNEIEASVQRCLMILKQKIGEWRKSEWLSNVHIGPERAFDEHIFARFTNVLNTLTAWYHPVNQAALTVNPDSDLLMTLCTTHPLSVITLFVPKLLSFEEDFITSCMIVSQQPPQTRTLENSKKNSSSTTGDETESASTEKKKKAAGKAFGSKKQQGYNTKIKLPGGDQFTSIYFKSGLIHCISEAELAQTKERGGTIDAPEESNLKWSDIKRPEGEFPGKCAEKEFLDVRISDHSRENKLKNHEEFVRICFFVTVEVNGREYKVQVLSLPFHFITGSNQLLSCLGSRLWYFGSTNDLYHGNFKMTDKLPVNKILELLDKRMRYVDANGRHLREEEKVFLKKLLPVENGMVSLNNFVKEEVVPRRGSKHTFYIWFHAVINTIETKWLRPWLDGAIYGLVDEEFGFQLLTQNSVNSRGKRSVAPIGTVVLRPGQMKIDKPNSSSPELALIAQVKCRQKDPESGRTEVVVKCIALTPDHINLNGLYRAVENLKDEDSKEKITLYLLGYNLNKAIEYLKRYNEAKEQYDDHYDVVTQRVLHLYISATSPSQQGQDPPKKQTSKKARRSRRQGISASSSTQAWSSFDEDLESPNHGEMSDKEVDFSHCLSQSKMEASPQSGHHTLKSQKSIEHSIVTVASMNGGVALKAESLSSSPLPEEHNYEIFNGVPIDTTALLKSMEKAKSGSSKPSEARNASDMISNPSPSSGFQTMSPASETNINSPSAAQTRVMSPHGGKSFAVVKQESPPFVDCSPQVLSQVMPDVSFSGTRLNDLAIGTNNVQVFVLENTHESFLANSASQIFAPDPETSGNLPTILTEAELQQSLPVKARRCGKGKQLTGQKGKKCHDDNAKLEQIISQPSTQIQQTSCQPQSSNIAEPQLLDYDGMIQGDSTMAPTTSSDPNDLVSIIQEDLNGQHDPILYPIMEGQSITGSVLIQALDALQDGEHMSEMLFDQCPEINRMDSGLGVESISPTTQPPNLKWV